MNGGSYSSVLMTATGQPDEYAATLSGLGTDSAVDYYIQASDLLANTHTDPLFAPTFFHSFEAVLTYDTVESPAGWTAGAIGDDATTGQWGHFDPVGTAAQPEDDATPDPGVFCFITGQCASGHGQCTTGCSSLGCNDVDGGTTTLLSPVYDLTGLTTAKIRYDRWYSNNTGSAPNSDTWIAEISHDSGPWTEIENTMSSAATWTSIEVDVVAMFGTPGTVQFRFQASDLGSGSIVEAGVDDIRVAGTTGGATDVSDLPSAAPRVLSLTQNQPNPFAAATRIDFAVPAQSEVTLKVYNVSGQVVRSLTEGVREAGQYHVQWDGRDSAGSRVSAGVYFYRLEAAGRTLTKKMTVMQ